MIIITIPFTMQHNVENALMWQLDLQACLHLTLVCGNITLGGSSINFTGCGNIPNMACPMPQ
jgi:hypothetical protein